MHNRSAKFQFFIALLLLCVVALAMYSNLSWDSTVHYNQPRGLISCACDKCPTDGDPYFAELINSSPKPFLSKNHPTSETDFNVWKSWQREQRNFTFYNMIVERLLQTFPPAPDDFQRRPNRCRTCAVVGNSGTLKGSHYGPLIDFHDIVIRMNRGRTKGFETDVGTKTTHHLLYPESATQLDNTTHLVFLPFKINDFLWLLKHFSPNEKRAVNTKTIANKDLVMILNPAFMIHVHHVWLEKRGQYPSTGFMTLFLSLQICDEVSVFGFGADSAGNWDHYFETLRNKRYQTGNHAGTPEMEMIRKLHDKQKIQFYKGW